VRNVWKGLIVGASTGAAIGLALDWGEAAQHRLGIAATRTASAIREHGPEIASAAVSRGAEAINDTDLPGRAQSLVSRLIDSDASDRARDALHVANETAQRGTQRLGEVAHQVSQTVDETARGRAID
jgi:hypothetical protein